MLQDPVRTGLRRAAEEKRARARAYNRFASPERFGALQVFTRWTASQDSAQALIDTAGVGPETQHLCRGEDVEDDCWWIVDVCGKDVVRFFDGTGGPVRPLLRTDIETNGVRSTRLRARITWIKTGQGCEVDVDIGTGFRLAIEGANVNVFLLLPKNESAVTPALATLPLQPIAPPTNPSSANQSVPIPNPVPPEIGQPSIILDSLVTGQVLKCTSTNADRVGLLTQTFERAAGDAEFPVEIPPRAKTVSVSMPAPGLLLPLQFRIGAAATSPIVKPVFFDIFNNVRSTTITEVPQNATHLTLGAADPVNARRWTIVWGLEL